MLLAVVLIIACLVGMGVLLYSEPWLTKNLFWFYGSGFCMAALFICLVFGVVRIFF